MSKTLTTLNRKHRLFVEAYTGEVISAMLAAGFEGSPEWLKSKGEEFLENPIIQEAIKERSRHMAKTFQVIADRDERLALLTSWMRNEDPYRKEERDASGVPIPAGNLPESMRAKALELLGKANGDFIDKVEVTGKLTLSDAIMKSYKTDELGMDDDAIEAEYWKAQEEKKNPSPLPLAPKGLESFI